MTGKNYGWHKKWAMNERGQLEHATGLLFETKAGEALRLVDESMDAFRTSEMARGVPAHDLPARLERLIKEAQMWLDHAEAKRAKARPPGGFTDTPRRFTDTPRRFTD